MIAVMGASGNTGGRISEQLLDKGENIRALGRSAAKLASDLTSVPVSAASTSDAHAVLLKAQRSGNRFSFSTIASPRKV
jgi:uncharacterized protein YbjT (DUF2867 family)